MMRKLLVIIFLLIAFPCFGADKNGVAPTTVSLPSGPGTIEGLGEAFQPMLNTGSARYAVAIALPPGTAGHAPTFTLQYDSGLGFSPISLGWSFGPGAISRRVDKGIPRYVDGPNHIDDDQDNTIDEPDETDIFVGPDGEELVRITDTIYRARIEGGFARFNRTVEGWQVDLKNGTTLEYGVSPAGRIESPDGKKFRWLLEKSSDVNGNTIEYIWSQLKGSDNQKFLNEIRYGPGSGPWAAFYFIKLGYEERPDPRVDFRSGFPVRTAHRLISIHIGIQGNSPDLCAAGDWNDDGETDALISRYLLDYDQVSPSVYQLIRVTRYGADGLTPLPPINFSYSGQIPEHSLSASPAIITSSNAPSSVMDSGLVELIDLNRDALPDILQTDYSGGQHRACINLGPDSAAGDQTLRWADPVGLSSPGGLAALLHLVEDRVSLADMNGDGLADLVHTTAAGQVFYFANKGDVSWGAQTPMSIKGSAPPAPFAFDNVKTADLDFNKRMDVIQSTSNGYTVWLNYLDGIFSCPFYTGGASYNGQVIQFSDEGVDFADMNGDRLSDVAKVTSTGVVYCPGSGHGTFAPSSVMMLPDTVLSDGSNGQIKRSKLTDVNGDGLADLVLERAAVGELWCWLNLGGSKFSKKYTITGMPTQFDPNTAVRWADMNGNSSTDLVYADSTTVEKLQIIDIGLLLGGSAHPNLLTGIDNGLGRQTTITYSTSTKQALHASGADAPWNSTIPFPVQVVSHVEVTTGVDQDMIPGPDRYEKTFTYRDGFYEDREQQFRGFAQVSVTEPGDATAPTLVTVNEFFTGGPDNTDNDGDGLIDEMSPDNHREEEALKGLPRSVATRTEDDTLFVKDENQWRVRTLPISNPDGREIRLAVNLQTEKSIYEGTDTPEILRITKEYDDFGNVTVENNHGALSISGDEVFTSTAYINDTDNWLIGLPYQQTIEDSAGQVAAETRSYYDGPEFVGLPAGSAVKGLLTRQAAWVEGDTWVDTTRNSYDSYGNIISALTPNGGGRSLSYDTLLHIFPVQEDIEVDTEKPDLSITADYHIGFGVVTASVDFNGHETRYHYDIFGRPTSFVLPGDNETLPSRSFHYSLCDPINSKLYDYDSQGQLSLTDSECRFSTIASSTLEQSGQEGTLDTIQYMDGMGRKAFSLTEAESDFIVQDRMLYNARGLALYSFLPYRSTAADAGNRPALTLPHTQIVYDSLGRAIEQTTPPDENSVSDSSSILFQPLKTTSTDERGNTRISFTDGLERLITVNENNGADIYITRYGYNTLGNLTSVLDNQNNLKTMTYDGLGRKISMADPDRGSMTYVYDAASNLIRTMDNKSQEIVYTYDLADRMVSEDYLDSAGLTPDVTYTYDQAVGDYPDARNLLGRLGAVSDLSGAAFFSYDPRGNSEWNIVRIQDGTSRVDFRLSREFDAMGRVTADIYPDGDRVEHTYNQRGLLESIPGFVDNLDYHVSGAMQTINYANTVNTTLQYDPRNRLLETFTAPQAGNVIQHLHYNFDPAGNILAITDLRSLTPGLPENATQSFLYDDLNRLVHAEGPGYGGINFQYDSIGNMIHKSSPAEGDPLHIDDPLINLQDMGYGGTAGSSSRTDRLPGDPAGPHALTSTQSGMTYAYDDNGNVISRNGDDYEWDFADRLVRAETGSSVTSYVYNSAGQRVIKRVEENGIVKSTWYVSEGYEIREGKTDKYIFAGSRRIARVAGHLTELGEETTQVVTLQPGWNFISTEMIVPAAELLAGVGASVEVWEWDGASQQYLGYVPSENRYEISTLQPGHGYIIYSDQHHTMSFSGIRSVADLQLHPGWNLIGCLADREMSMEEMVQQLNGNVASAWEYDPFAGTWRNFLGDGPDFLNSLAAMVPGRAYWLQMNGSISVSQLQTPQSIHFYHPDHLGSSSLVTDSTGDVAERVEYYPFGRPRYEYRDSFDSPYKYTDKELDKETGLMYYEARYYDPVIGRFMSVDPLLTENIKIQQSYKLNLYSYGANNPIKYIDQLGLDAEEEVEKYEKSINWKLVGKGVLNTAVGALGVAGGTAAVVASPVTLGLSGWLGVSGIMVGTPMTGLGLSQVMVGLYPATPEEQKRQMKDQKVAEKVVKTATLDPGTVSGLATKEGLLRLGADKETAALLGDSASFAIGSALGVPGKLDDLAGVKNAMETATDEIPKMGAAVQTLVGSALSAADKAQNIGNIVDEAQKRSASKRQRSKTPLMSVMPDNSNRSELLYTPADGCGVTHSCSQ